MLDIEFPYEKVCNQNLLPLNSGEEFNLKITIAIAKNMIFASITKFHQTNF